MSPRSALGAILACTLASAPLVTACEESTSGADRVATLAVDGGSSDTDADADSNTSASRCSTCAATNCRSEIDTCGDACAPALACVLDCRDDAACEEDCLHDNDAAKMLPVKSCLLTSCAKTSACGSALALLTELAGIVHEECAKYDSCAHAHLVYRFGDVATCEQRVALGYTFRAFLTDTGLSSATLRACKTSIGALSCEDYFSSRSTSGACAIQGTRANGRGCYDDVQCQSGFCSSEGWSCGVCSDPPTSGSACKSGRCPAGMQCTANTCLTTARNNEACSATRPCEDPYRCLSGTCKAPSTTVGAMCGTTTTSPNCDWRAGFLCTSATSGTCATYAAGGAGATCGVISGVYRICRNGAACVSSQCSAPPAEGGACDATNGPSCTYPDLCVASKCVSPPSPSSCP